MVFSLINFIAFVLIFITCGFAAYFRGKQSVQYVEGQPSDKLYSMILVFYISVIVLMVTTSIFLADALRRLRKSIEDHSKLKISKRIMSLHIFVNFFHTIFFTASTITVIASLIYPDSNYSTVWNVSKILDFLTQSISQLIIMYLIHHFEKPILLKNDSKRESVSSELSNRLELLNTLKYVMNTQQPKMIKSDNFNSEQQKRKDTFTETESIKTNDEEIRLTNSSLLNSSDTIKNSGLKITKRWGKQETALRA